jgi:dipeptidyl-peptidase-3
MLIIWHGMGSFAAGWTSTHGFTRAAWHGTRILLRQTSPEGEGIFDLILTLNREVVGDWRMLLGISGLTEHDLDMLLEYFAMFLANIGNYRVSEKFTCCQVDQQ